MKTRKKVCIFCGANNGNSEEIVKQAKELCKLLIQNNCDLVYGGGKTGLMGIVANEFLDMGCEVIGVRPKKLIEDEEAHYGLSELVVVKTMGERKDKMTELSDFFVALPGGIGTLDEIIETFMLQKIGFIDKPSAVLNTDGYYDGLQQLLKKMQSNEFLTAKSKKLLVIENTPEKLVEKLDLFAVNLDKRIIIDKIAFIEIKEGRILASRSFGKDKFYIPGGKRDFGENDEETLIREVYEELSVDIVPGSAKYVGTFEAQAHGKAEGVIIKMACYRAEYSGLLNPSNEIEEIEWLNYSDIERVSYVDKIIFNYLKDSGELV